MADSKLTDLPEMSVSTLNNDDVLYIASNSLKASNKITYANLINTKFVSLSSKHDTLQVNFDSLQSNFDDQSVQFNSLNTSITSYKVAISGFDLAAAIGSRFTSTFFVPSAFGLRVGDLMLPTMVVSGAAGFNFNAGSTSVAGPSGVTFQMQVLSAGVGDLNRGALVRFDAFNFTGGAVKVGSTGPHVTLHSKIFYREVD